jgi:predicted Zn-dependent protease
MNKYLFILLFACLCSCNSCSSDSEDNKKEEIVLSNEELLIKRYNELVLPMFKSYNGVEIPTEFQVDAKDKTINAGASFGYVEVSQGLIEAKKEALQIFVLSHEVSHIVTISQAKLFDLKGEIPRGAATNDYKKAEYLADLIAVHLMKTKLPKEFESLYADFDYLQQLLGAATFTHPSGLDRINSLKEYIRNSKEENEPTAFKKQFLSIWNRD